MTQISYSIDFHFKHNIAQRVIFGIQIKCAYDKTEHFYYVYNLI